MGVDINIVTEIFNPKTKEWEFYSSGYMGVRDYFLYAILADVKNGYCWGLPQELVNDPMFKLLDSGNNKLDRIEPIASRRGLPEDLSKDAEEILTGEDSSYFTLQELLDFDWDQVVYQNFEGVISLEEYKDYVEKRTLPLYHRTANMSKNYISVEEAEKILKGYDPIENWKQGVYLKTKYPEGKYREVVQEEWWEFIEDIKEGSDNYKEIRIVFNFGY